MTKEMEYAKCIAVLKIMLNQGIVSEKEYLEVKSKLMDKYMVVNNFEGPAA